MADDDPVAVRRSAAPYFESIEHYDALVAMHLAAGTLIDERMVYWDIRPSTHLPTVEVRVSDVPAHRRRDRTPRDPRPRAGDDCGPRGNTSPTLEPEDIRAAYWLAARDGITGGGLDVRSAEPMPMTEVIERLRKHVEPALQDLGDAELVDDALQRVLAIGNGAVRQRKAFRKRVNLIALTEVRP